MTEDTAPETRDASEAVRILTANTVQRISQMVQELAGVAMRDAKLDPKDGWQYDVERGVYVRAS